MYTTEQTQALKEYNTALNDYNQGNITYERYIELTLPLWEKLNILFEKTQK
jgi:hypothetical protein